MQRVTYKPYGVILDRPPSEVPPDYWTYAENAVPRSGQMTTPDGFRQVLADPNERVVGIVNTTAEGTSYWVLGGRPGIYALEPDATFTNITPTSGWSTTGQNTWTIDDCCTALLNGYPLVKLGGNAPVHWDADLTNDAIFATSDSGGTSWDYGTVGAMWAFRNHVFVGDVGGDANVLAWSDAVPPAVTAGTTGIDFYPTTTNQAGTADLGDLVRIQNGLALNRSCMIYGRAQTYICDYIGGNFVFAFRLLSGETGAISRHSMTDIGNAHVVVSQDDVLLTDGRDFRSIADQAVRRELFDLMDTEIAYETWVQHYRKENEVWIGIPTGGNGVQLGAVYDIGTGRWGFKELRDVGGAETAVSCVAYGIVSETSVNQLWSDFTATTWAAVDQTWDATGFSDDREKLVGGLQTVRDFSGSDDGILIQFDESATDADGEAIQSRLYRYGLDLGDPNAVKVVTGLHINGDFEQDLYVKVGARMFENGDTVWEPTAVLTPSATQKVDFTATGRLIDVQLIGSGQTRIAGFSLEVASVSPH